MRIVILLIVIGICIVLVLPTYANQPQTSPQQMEFNHPEEQIHTITQQEIFKLTDAFIDLLVQDITDQYQVKNHPNKDSLMNAFEAITTRDVVKPYIEYYFYEENGALYIVPTELPAWFDKQNKYDVVQLEDNKVLVRQENQSEFYGDYSIEFEFSYVDQAWKITKITHQ